MRKAPSSSSHSSYLNRGGGGEFSCVDSLSSIKDPWGEIERKRRRMGDGESQGRQWRTRGEGEGRLVE